MNVVLAALAAVAVLAAVAFLAVLAAQCGCRCQERQALLPHLRHREAQQGRLVPLEIKREAQEHVYRALDVRQTLEVSPGLTAGEGLPASVKEEA